MIKPGEGVIRGHDVVIEAVDGVIRTGQSF